MSGEPRSASRAPGGDVIETARASADPVLGRSRTLPRTEEAELPQRRRRILIFEPTHLGHRLEWLEHLARHMHGREPGADLMLLVPPELARPLEAQRGERVEVIELGPAEIEACATPKLTANAFAQMRVMRRHLARTGAMHGHFFYLDLLALPLGVGLGVGGPSLSGILFRPSVHYPTLGDYRPDLKGRVRDHRTGLLYRLMLRNPALQTVFSLDPYFTAYAAKRYGSRKVVTLPDPYYPAGSGTSPAVQHDPPPPDRITFLLFGVLTDRKKGVVELLQALRGLAPEAARRIAIRIAGRIDPPVAEQVQQLADAVRAERPELWLQIEGRHLSSGELAQAIAASQVVLITYQRSIGSSGALVWAARDGKPVIAQEYGLLGRFVRDYRLGITVQTDDPAAMARGIETVVREGVDSIADPAGMRNFLAGREPERFARIIVDTILGIRPQEDAACASPITVAQGSS